MSATAVVQLGLEMIPRCPATSSPLISGTTRGTFSVNRNADELSTTTAPEFTATGTNSLEIVAPALKNTTSMQLKESTVSALTSSSSPRNARVLPAERADANKRIEATGKFRRSITRNISSPTAPVAPTIATRRGLLIRKHSIVAVCASLSII